MLSIHPPRSVENVSGGKVPTQDCLYAVKGSDVPFHALVLADQISGGFLDTNEFPTRPLSMASASRRYLPRYLLGGFDGSKSRISRDSNAGTPPPVSEGRILIPKLVLRAWRSLLHDDNSSLDDIPPWHI